MLILLFSNGVFAFLLDKTREKRVIFIWFHACIFKSLLLLLLLRKKKKIRNKPRQQYHQRKNISENVRCWKYITKHRKHKTYCWHNSVSSPPLTCPFSERIWRILCDKSNLQQILVPKLFPHNPNTIMFNSVHEMTQHHNPKTISCQKRT
jgi:hypothetical protein